MREWIETFFCLQIQRESFPRSALKILNKIFLEKAVFSTSKCSVLGEEVGNGHRTYKYTELLWKIVSMEKMLGLSSLKGHVQTIQTELKIFQDILFLLCESGRENFNCEWHLSPILISRFQDILILLCESTMSDISLKHGTCWSRIRSDIAVKYCEKANIAETGSKYWNYTGQIQFPTWFKYCVNVTNIVEERSKYWSCTGQIEFPMWCKYCVNFTNTQNTSNTAKYSTTKTPIQ